MYKVKCSRCFYHFIVNKGHGFDDCEFFEENPDTGKPYYYGYIDNKSIIDDVDNILEIWESVVENEEAYSKNNGWHGHGSAQYLCPKCGRLHNKFYFSLIGSGGTYEPVYQCKKCKSELILVDLFHGEYNVVNVKTGQEVKWRCPICRSRKLVDKSERWALYYD